MRTELVEIYADATNMAVKAVLESALRKYRVNTRKIQKNATPGPDLQGTLTVMSLGRVDQTS